MSGMIRIRREPSPEVYRLQLFVAGQSSASARALENLQRICDTALDGRYQLEVIDIGANPDLAAREKILATPTLVQQHPRSTRHLIGDMSDAAQVLRGLDLPRPQLNPHVPPAPPSPHARSDNPR